MSQVAFDAPSGGYWLINDRIKLLVEPSGKIAHVTHLGLARDMAYFYPWLNYWTEGGANGSFYLHTIGDYTITPIDDAPALANGEFYADGSITASGDTGSKVELTKTYTDANGVIHALKFTVEIHDFEDFAKITFEDTASVGMKQIQLNIEANLYPQGYAGQGAGGSFNAGGSAAHTAPAPYDNATYAFFADGLIKQDALELETVSIMDAYLACYSADASVGLFTNYVDLNKLRVYTLNTGDERQYGWLDLLPRPYDKYTFKIDFYVGAWADPSAVSCKAAYDALPLVEELFILPTAQYNKIVRTDLNANLYDYHEKFHDILSRITTSTGNATLVPAGTPSFKFYKHRGYSSTWNATVLDIHEDFVLKSLVMSREAGHRLFVEVDILDGIWNTADPTNKAIEADEVTQSYYWPKLHRLITPGEAYHDAFIAHATYLCQKYNFYGLVLSECSYKHVDYSAEAKALFLADNPGYTDWPRLADGAIDTEDETLGKWKTEKLGAFWDELRAIAAANNKRFFLMVEPNFEDENRQAWEYGQYWPEAIQHCDGLWVWGYYGYFEVHPFLLENIADKLEEIQATHPSSENIISIGLWGPGEDEITSYQLNHGLNVLNYLSWPQNGQGIEVTPSKHMTDAHWNVLWGTSKLGARFAFKTELAGRTFTRQVPVSI